MSIKKLVFFKSALKVAFQVSTNKTLISLNRKVKTGVKLQQLTTTDLGIAGLNTEQKSANLFS